MDDATRMTEELKELVEKHTVCYEVFPDRLMVKGEPRTAGYELQLFGSHEHGTSRMTPGCEICVHTFRDLLRIAESILPREARDSKYEIREFDAALHMAPGRGLRPEVALSIMIEHKHDPEAPIDNCETQCLHEMEQRLRDLGVRRGN